MRWDEILSSVTMIPLDDVLESLYKLRIRESDQLKTVLELHDMEIHQKISMPNYQKLTTMVKRSMDLKLRLRNFDARHRTIETGAVVTNRRSQRGLEKGQGECNQGKAKGQCSRGDKCGFRHDEDKRAKPTPKTAPPSQPPTQRGGSASRTKNLRGWSPSGKFARQPCKVYVKCICTKSPCDYWHPPTCHFFQSESGCKFGDKCSFSHRQVEGQPSKKPKKDCDKSAVAILKDARQLGCVSQDTELPESLPILWTSPKVLGSIRRVRFSNASQRHANIRESEGPSLGNIQVKVPLLRSPYALKFEDRSQEETERQEPCARGDARRLANNILKLKEKEEATCSHLPTNGVSQPHPQ